ncbi:hypothetical protein BX600DRAFT_461228 [Xylariales sp. PMI_506]|nr:hypothetical protein BX600DRAFT_461228 [Xylariales sp. PMI_506]
MADILPPQEPADILYQTLSKCLGDLVNPGCWKRKERCLATKEPRKEGNPCKKLKLKTDATDAWQYLEELGDEESLDSEKNKENIVEFFRQVFCTRHKDIATISFYEWKAARKSTRLAYGETNDDDTYPVTILDDADGSEAIVNIKYKEQGYDSSSDRDSNSTHEDIASSIQSNDEHLDSASQFSPDPSTSLSTPMTMFGEQSNQRRNLENDSFTAPARQFSFVEGQDVVSRPNLNAVARKGAFGQEFPIRERAGLVSLTENDNDDDNDDDDDTIDHSDDLLGEEVDTEGQRLIGDYVKRNNTLSSQERVFKAMFSKYQQSSKKGIVYVLVKKKDARFLKVGFTTRDVKARLADASNCNGKEAEVEYASPTRYKGAYRVERLVLADLRQLSLDIRVCTQCKHGHTEWFQATKEQVVGAVLQWETIVNSPMFEDGKLGDTGREVLKAMVGPQMLKVVQGLKDASASKQKKEETILQSPGAATGETSISDAPVEDASIADTSTAYASTANASLADISTLDSSTENPITIDEASQTTTTRTPKRIETVKTLLRRVIRGLENTSRQENENTSPSPKPTTRRLFLKYKGFILRSLPTRRKGGEAQPSPTVPSPTTNCHETGNKHQEDVDHTQNYAKLFVTLLDRLYNQEKGIQPGVVCASPDPPGWIGQLERSMLEVLAQLNEESNETGNIHQPQE